MNDELAMLRKKMQQNQAPMLGTPGGSPTGQPVGYNQGLPTQSTQTSQGVTAAQASPQLPGGMSAQPMDNNARRKATLLTAAKRLRDQLAKVEQGPMADTYAPRLRERIATIEKRAGYVPETPEQAQRRKFRDLMRSGTVDDMELAIADEKLSKAQRNAITIRRERLVSQQAAEQKTQQTQARQEAVDERARVRQKFSERQQAERERHTRVMESLSARQELARTQAQRDKAGKARETEIKRFMVQSAKMDWESARDDAKSAKKELASLQAKARKAEQDWNYYNGTGDEVKRDAIGQEWGAINKHIADAKTRYEESTAAKETALRAYKDSLKVTPQEHAKQYSPPDNAGWQEAEQELKENPYSPYVVAETQMRNGYWPTPEQADALTPEELVELAEKYKEVLPQ